MTHPQRWATSCDGEAAQTAPMELAALGEHTAECSATSGRMAAVQCGAGQVLGFVTARLVTTVAVLVVLIVAGLMWT
jgi:hypothetical protein